jgi:hypothetical protein
MQPIAIGTPRRDRGFDLTLRILMLALTAILIGCIGLLAWRWSHPPVAQGPVVPVTAVTPKAAPERATATVIEANQVLLAPGSVFRCDNGGTVTFSDSPCPAAKR